MFLVVINRFCSARGWDTSHSSFQALRKEVLMSVAPDLPEANTGP
jgi:hypothetical protein